MFTPLPKDFTIERYGLTARLVNESDTEYILSLRTDKKLSKYIHETEDSTTKQLDWFRKYKLREYENRDYYFIYEKDGKPFSKAPTSMYSPRLVARWASTTSEAPPSQPTRMTSCPISNRPALFFYRKLTIKYIQL